MSHNYSKRYIRKLLIQIGKDKVREACKEEGLTAEEPLSNFCLERNENGEFLQYEPTGTIIMNLEDYEVPKYGWTKGGNYNKKNQ